MVAPPVVRTARRACVLLVLMEPHLAERVEASLRPLGYRVSICPPVEPAVALDRVQSEVCDIVILSGSSTGLAFCRNLRRVGVDLPVLMLLDSDDISERVAGLDAGADDLIFHPYTTEALIDRIQCQLKRAQGNNDGTLRLADLVLSTRTREVHRGNRTIELTAREFHLLRFLLEHAREVLSREQILSNVWGEDFDGESNIVEVYIRYLRMKVEREGEKKLIHTVRSVGYTVRE